MKRMILTVLFSVSILTLISWGFKGHRVVAAIAQKHLTSNTAYNVSAYLRGESMAEVSTWADENRSNITAPWHFLNLPLGLNHDQFAKFVSQSDGNVYTAIVKTEAQLKDKSLTADQKNEALKYLIHLIGDAHQPMHVSRKEDKGGNTVQVRFEDKGTNLHSLWDSKLIDHEGLSLQDMAKQYDTATSVEIKKWQTDSPMEWLWESYRISSELYAGVKPGQTIDEAYYQKYIPVIHQRIEQAGIRLAGELNKLFNAEAAPSAPVSQALQDSAKGNSGIIGQIDAKDAAKYVGKTVSMTGKIYSVKDIGSMILANMGAAYPNQSLTLAIKGAAKATGAGLEGKIVTVTGEVIEYKGKPEMVITDKSQMKF